MNNGKTTSKWSLNAPVRPVFRIIGGILSICFLSFSIYILFSEDILHWDGFSLFFPSSLCGVVIGFACLKGRLPKWFINDSR